jgi:hypothetical protein
MDTLVLRWKDQYVNVNVSPIISCLILIPRIINWMCIITEKNLGYYSLLPNYKSLDLCHAPNTKPFLD